MEGTIMENLNFDEGYKTFMLNGDPDRVIRVNTGDVNIIRRYNKAMKDLDEYMKSLPDDINLDPDGEIIDEGQDKQNLDEAARALEEFDGIVREKLDYIFNADIYDIVFKDQSPLSIVGTGDDAKYLVESFLDAIMSEVQGSAEIYNRETRRRMQKYQNRARRYK